jgi:very-short-patch-repair endonuclease
MVAYLPHLKVLSRNLRSNQTDAEQKLWFHLRRKQLGGVQFFRQRPIGEYIADFFAPTIQLVIEVDGSQHQDTKAVEYDHLRTEVLEKQGITVLRFDNLQVLQQTTDVLEKIHTYINRTQ